MNEINIFVPYYMYFVQYIFKQLSLYTFLTAKFWTSCIRISISITKFWNRALDKYFCGTSNKLSGEHKFVYWERAQRKSLLHTFTFSAIAYFKDFGSHQGIHAHMQIFLHMCYDRVFGRLCKWNMQLIAAVVYGNPSFQGLTLLYWESNN